MHEKKCAYKQAFTVVQYQLFKLKNWKGSLKGTENDGRTKEFKLRHSLNIF